jgi:hypothetical protein
MPAAEELGTTMTNEPEIYELEVVFQGAGARV